jgi:FAD-dependent urate hydroxylase
MSESVRLLIIGAGPFGVALSAYAKAKNIEHIVVGKPWDFWKNNMPDGMCLRSGTDWHLDPLGVHTIDAYLQSQNKTPCDVEPLSRDFYLGYCEWFQQQKGIETRPVMVRRLDYADGASPYFEAALENGETILAENAVLALGFRYFKNVPEPVANLFPRERVGHTCDVVDFAPLKNRRVLIVGGRQSAFEWAALLREAGAAHVYVAYRHPTPAFTHSDWAWVNPILESMVEHPRWFRELPKEQKDEIRHHMWVEGRAKLEPWLEPRIRQSNITLMPLAEVKGAEELPSGELEVTLEHSGEDVRVPVDQVIFATGYKVDVSQVPLLQRGNILSQLKTDAGFPVLDEHFQSSVPGLYFTSMAAAQDFGPFFGFTSAVRTSARVIGAGLTVW